MGLVIRYATQELCIGDGLGERVQVLLCLRNIIQLLKLREADLCKLRLELELFFTSFRVESRLTRVMHLLRSQQCVANLERGKKGERIPVQHEWLASLLRQHDDSLTLTLSKSLITFALRLRSYELGASPLNHNLEQEDV